MANNIHKRLHTSKLVMFAAPGFISAIMQGPSGGILAGVYAKHFGVGLAALGTAMLVGRLFDAVTDPLIGYLSDRTQSRFGRRKPWIVTGYAMAIIAFYFLYVPGDSASISTFLFWYMALALAWTVAEIPYQAWQAEITHDYDERARVSTYRVFAQNAGRVGFAILPLLPLFATAEITPEVLEFLAWVVIFVLPLTVLIAVAFVPQGRHLEVKKTASLWGFAKTLPGNKPAMLLLGVSLLSGIGDGFFSASLFLYFDVFLQEGDKVAYAIMMMGGAALVVMPFWLKVMHRIGKHQTWALANGLTALVLLTFLFISPGGSAYIFALGIVAMVILIYTGGGVAAPAVLADVIDFDTLLGGANRAGQFFALWTLIFKFNYALAAAGALWCLDVFGFNPAAATQTSVAAYGIKFTIGVVPALLIGASVILLVRFPLNKRRCAIVGRRLEQRRHKAEEEAAASNEI